MIRFPLSAKILLWFVLNLIFLAIVFSIFVTVQFRFGLDSLLMGRAGDRIQAVTDLIAFELNQAQHEEWDALLKQYSQQHHVHFVLFQMNGMQVAGEHTMLPREVGNRLMQPNFPGPQGPGGGLRGPMRPPDGNDRPQPDFDQPNGPQMPPGERPFGPRGIQPMPPGGDPPRFMLHTSDPSRYWVGVRLRIRDNERGGPMPMVLLAVSDSIRGSGLFVDFMPWLIVGAGAIVLSVLFWIPLVRGITRSISQMTHATEQIAQGRFDTTVATERRDELGRLGQAINQMASRLSGFVTGQKRFLGDTAHELCSPIARIQVALGILEQRADDSQKAYVEDLREEVQQMSNLVNELLSFSKASLEPAAIKLQSVNLLNIVEQAVQRESVGEANVTCDVSKDFAVMADKELLLRSLANLVRNAIRYAGHAGQISITARRDGDKIIISVTDSGPGVPEAALAQLFDPFYRTDPSRAREAGGVGLGLAIVKKCIESCRGTVQCHNRQPSGLEVLITLQPASA